MGDALHVATRKGLFTYRRKGAAWESGPPAFLGENVVAVLDDPRDGALYASLRLGHFGPKLHRSRDGGATWEQLTPPRFDQEPAMPGFEDIEAFMAAAEARKAAPASVDMMWTLEAGGADEPGVIWAGTIPGGLFKSEDHGESWRLVEPLWNAPQREKWNGGGYDDPGIHTVYVDPRDSAKVTLAISSGGVWTSDDRGESWRNVGQGLRAEYCPPDMAYDIVAQDVHRLAHCTSDPETVWCQHHNGVFLSRDGGTTFDEIKDIKPSVFGFAVASHPDDPDTAWLVPGIKDEKRVPVDGKLVVNRTRDGGKTFEALSDGLPQSDCWDLVYRHGLAVDAAGDGLVMGSTTGNLWVSDDGGDGWTCLSTHLPPVAAVAWASQ